MISVVVADDHPLARAGVVGYLGQLPDIDVVAEAQDGDEAVELALLHRPDVVLMDVEMPGTDGVEAIERLDAAGSSARVVVLTSFDDRETVTRALGAGACGYLVKDADPQEIAGAVRAAAAGNAPLSAASAAVLLSAWREGGSARPEDELTGRGRDVLRLVGEGLPNKLIAQELGISEKTVKTHLTRVFSALGVHDRTEAALWAQRHLL